MNFEAREWAELTGLSAGVCAALLADGLEPPDRERVDAQGWPSHRYVKALERHYLSALPEVC